MSRPCSNSPRGAGRKTAITAVFTAIGGQSLGASVVTVAEVLVGPVATGAWLGSKKPSLNSNCTASHSASRRARQLARLRADTALKLPDCCVLLVAETKGGSVVTFDAALARAARRRDVDVVGPLAGVA